MSGWTKSMSSVPGAIISLLPNATCPACLGAYAGLVSALGIGFLFTRSVLIPLLVFLLLLGVVGGVAAKRRHRRLFPLVLTVAGSIAILLGRIVWDVPVAVYGGAVLLLTASLSNLYLRGVSSEETLVQLRTR